MKFFTLPLYSLPPDQVRDYWKDLYDSGYLKPRLCDVPNPSLSNAVHLMNTHGDGMYFVAVEGKLVGEFTLDNFTGKAAQIHFSTHPDLRFKDAVPLVRDVVRSIFNWTVQGKEETYLDSLYGITPITNRAACIFVLRVGFEKQFILPSGMRDGDDVVDGMVSTYTRKKVLRSEHLLEEE